MRIRTLLNIIIFVLVFPLIIFSTLSFYLTKSRMVNHFTLVEKQNLQQVTRQVEENLKSSFAAIEMLSNLRLFQKYHFREVPVELIQDNLNSFFNRYADQYERLVLVNKYGTPLFSIHRLYIVNGEKKVFVSTASFQSVDTLHFFHRAQSLEKIFLSPSFFDGWGFVVRAGIVLPGEKVLFMDIRVNRLFETLPGELVFSNKSSYFVVNRGGKILYAKNPLLVNQNLLSNKPVLPGFTDEIQQSLGKFEENTQYLKNDKLLLTRYAGFREWKIISFFDLAEFVHPIHVTGYYNIGLGIMVLLIFLAISGWLSSKLTGSMRMLVSGAQNIAAGQFDYQIQLGNIYELRTLAAEFNRVGGLLRKYIGSIKKMHLEVVEKKKVEEISELKSRFISHVSHEMMTPLTAVKWSVDNLLAGVGGTVNTKQKEYLVGLKDVSDHLSRIFSDMLDLSRIEAGKLDLIFSDFDLKEAINEAVYLAQTSAHKKEIKFDLQADGHFPFYGDKIRIVQIFRNIIENGIKYSPPDSAISIRVNWKSGGEHSPGYCIEIQDSGPGISKEELPHIFDRFFKGSNRKKGIGLGLAIARNLAGLHGGTISVESKPGEGATFAVWLPVKQEQENA